MKYAIVIPDGLADFPLTELDGRTPVEVARVPNMDAISQTGKLGTAVTIPRGMAAGSDVATLSLLGYDPQIYYTGRAPLEAASLGVEVGEADLAFRGNLVTVSDGMMVDYSGGHIRTEEADVLLGLLRQHLAGDQISFHLGTGYRHLMVYRGEEPMEVKTTPPHDIMGEPIKPHLPRGQGAEVLCELMERSSELLADHAVNTVRRDLGENPATMIWLWGQGRRVQVPGFEERFGLRAGVISAVDLVNGIGVLLGMERIRVPGATGYYDTDYAAKGRYGAEALDRLDLVFVHVEAPDEAAHDGSAHMKVECLEHIDRYVVGPVWEALKGRGEYRMMVASDHYTSTARRTHVAHPVPFAVCGTGLEPIRGLPFTEANAAVGELEVDRGHLLMEYFLGKH
ncbi:MAG: cofactor-independent phosphoglycerate mutase [Planctomycetes bacterium]|nr:cofactor-independent phosphoglycerate mutase [Planctomycetota bacterium]